MSEAALRSVADPGIAEVDVGKAAADDEANIGQSRFWFGPRDSGLGASGLGGVLLWVN